MSKKNTPDLTADEQSLINAFRRGDKAAIGALTGKLLVKHEQQTMPASGDLAADLIAAMEAQNTDATGDILATLFKRYFPADVSTAPKAEPQPLELDDMERAVIEALRGGTPAQVGEAVGLAVHRRFPGNKQAEKEAEPYRGTHYSLGTTSTAHKGGSELAYDSDYLRRAWYIMGALVEAGFVDFEFDRPEWEHKVEFLLIVLSQAIKQTER